MPRTVDLSRGPALLSLSVGTASFAFATCIVRYCVRKRISNNVGIDDYAIGVATLIAFIGTIFSIIEGTVMNSSARALEFDFLGQPWFMMGATLAKISICLFFIRLVGGVKQWRILLGVMITLMAVVNFAFSLTTNLQCRPLEKLWNPTVDGQCWDPNMQLNIGYFQGAFSVFSWLFLSLFPVLIVRDLEMHRAMRWPFYFLSSLSLVAGIFATARTYEISQVDSGVYTFDTFCAQLLAILEQNIGLVAGNVLPMGPLFSSRARRLDRSPRLLLPSRTGSNAAARSARYSTDDESASSINMKRSSVLVIEGPRRVSFDAASSRLSQDFGGANATARSASRGSDRDRERGSAEWPRGIIKTVSVHVVEEDITDYERELAASRASGRTGEMDWEAMLRGGPAR